MSSLIKTDFLVNSFVILFHFLNFAVGLAALFIIFRRIGPLSPQLRRSFFQQAFFYNLTLILSAVTDFLDYFFRSIVSNSAVTGVLIYFINVLALASYFTWSLSFAQMVLFFLGNDSEIRKKRWFQYLFSAVMAYLLILFVLRIFRLYPYLYFYSSLVLVFSSLGVVLVYSIFLGRRIKKGVMEEREPALRMLSRLFIAFGLINICVYLNLYPFDILSPVVTKFSYNIMDLLYNGLVIFWTMKFLHTLKEKYEKTENEMLPVNEIMAGSVSLRGSDKAGGKETAGGTMSEVTEFPEISSADKVAERYQISRRELEVIELVCAGKSNQEIADTLFISLGTVKNHLYNIYAKAGIKNRTQLVKLFR